MTNFHTGLDGRHAAELLSKRKKPYSGDLILLFEALANQIRSIFFILLLISAGLSYWLENYTDAWIFIILNLLNVVLGFFQEFKASKASKTLQKMVHQRVTVLRDGKRVSIESDDVVKGDIVFLAPGNVFVSDMIVRSSAGAFIDESVRTGESVPREIPDIDPTASESSGDSQGDLDASGNAEPIMVYAGTSIVGGSMIGEVSESPDESSLIKYSQALKKIRKDNNFAAFVKKVSIYILFITLICLVAIAVFSVLIQGKYTVTTFILFAISMLVGVVPESLSLIITLMLTREALILSREGVIVKNLSALQQLGSIRYLLTDKTGTLTENAINLVDTCDVSSLKDILAIMSTAEYEKTPMDIAFDSALAGSVHGKIGDTVSADTPIHLFAPRKAKFTPFSNKRGFAIFDFEEITIIRGQFHAVLAASAFISEARKAELTEKYESYEKQGLRVLAFASNKKSNNYIAESALIIGSGAEGNANTNIAYSFSGFTVFEDPIKKDASQSYLAADGLGIMVKILTGDSALVARYIASKLDKRLDGHNVEELGVNPVSNLSKTEVEDVRIYARCMPEQKLELINAHIKLGATGFLGEGINDALALKRADVGIVVTNASDVARQSADILLTEKSLNPIISAIHLSRHAYAHISTYLLCTLTGNIGTLISLTLVALFWVDLPMLPIQILLNNLLTDVPLIFLIADRLHQSEYSKPISHAAKDFFKTIFIFAFISSVFDILYFYMVINQPIDTLRTGWFVFSVLAELALVFSLRSKVSVFKAPRMSPWLGWAIGLSAFFAIILMYIKPLATELSLVPLSLSNMLLILVLTVVYMVINELYKWAVRKP